MVIMNSCLRPSFLLRWLRLLLKNMQILHRIKSFARALEKICWFSSLVTKSSNSYTNDNLMIKEQMAELENWSSIGVCQLTHSVVYLKRLARKWGEKFSRPVREIRLNSDPLFTAYCVPYLKLFEKIHVSFKKPSTYFFSADKNEEKCSLIYKVLIQYYSIYRKGFCKSPKPVLRA